MPLQQNKRSLLQKILSGGAQGASQALLLQSLLGTEDQTAEAGLPPGTQSPVDGPLPLGDADTEFVAGAPTTGPPGTGLPPLAGGGGGGGQQIPEELLQLMAELGLPPEALPELIKRFGGGGQGQFGPGFLGGGS